jgi:hypothetical protein
VQRHLHPAVDRFTSRTIEMFHRGKRVAAHAEVLGATDATESHFAAICCRYTCGKHNLSGCCAKEQWRTEKPVLCVPGLGLLDEAVALMVAQLVEREGIGARAEYANALSMSRIFGLDTEKAAFICLCYVENASSAQIRYAVRRLRRKAPKAFILVSLLEKQDLKQPRNGDEKELFKEPLKIALIERSPGRSKR